METNVEALMFHARRHKGQNLPHQDFTADYFCSRGFHSAPSVVAGMVAPGRRLDGFNRDSSAPACAGSGCRLFHYALEALFR